MANKQLTDYLKEQISHGASIDQLRTMVLNQGWSEKDVNEAIEEVRSESHAQNVREHHNNPLAIGILSIIVLIIAGGLLLLVFKPQISNGDGDKTILPTPIKPTIKEPVQQELTGWAVCEQETDSLEKNACYLAINKEDKTFDCDKIDDKIERNFCYRAKETIVLEEYNAE